MIASKAKVSNHLGSTPFTKGLLLGLLVLLIASVVVLSSVPPVSKDALVHHLAVPRLYLEHGGIYEIPFMASSYFPMNLDLLYMIPLYFGNDIIPKFIHFSFGLLTALLIFGYLRRRIGTHYGLLGVIFFLSVPVIFKLSITVYVDLGVVFFTTASLFLLFKWVDSHFQKRYLLLSAVMCGLAMGTKYNGLISLALLTLTVPYLFSKHRKEGRPGLFRPLGYGVLFFLVAIVVFSPWMIRNYRWKSNPIYPFYDRFFNPPKAVINLATPKEASKKSNKGIFTKRAMIYNETGWEIALLPVRIFFQGKDGDPQYFDGKLNPFLLFLPFFAFSRRRGGAQNLRIERRVMLALAVFFFSFALFSFDLRMRYFAPIIPPLVILSVFGVKNLIEASKMIRIPTFQHLGKVFIFLVVVLSLFLNARYLKGQFIYVAPFDYLRGRIGRDEYISKYRPEYPAMQFINQNLPPDTLVSFIFLGKRGYYCERKYIFGESGLGRLISRASTPVEIFMGLKESGVTHLFIYFDIFQRWVKYNNSTEKQNIVNNFLIKNTKLIYHKNGFGVLNLVNPSS